MLNRNDIKKFLRSTIRPGTTIHVSDIHALIQHHFILSPVDLAPHTKSRSTSYPKWREKVQGVLSEFKKKGIITHHPTTKTYDF